MGDIKCSLCNSSKIMNNVSITDFGHGNVKKNLAVYIQKTDRAFFNTSIKGEIKAKICGDCGHIELKIGNPKELWDAYLKNK